jgi:hypothetical protein
MRSVETDVATWIVPSIDVQVACEYAQLIGQQHAELIVRAIQTALKELSAVGNVTAKRRVFVWVKHTGINEDGTIGEAWKFAQIAQTLGVSRNHVVRLYLEADSHVMRWISQAQNRIIQQLMYAS